MLTQTDIPFKHSNAPAVSASFDFEHPLIIAEHWPGPNWVPLAVAAHSVVERMASNRGREQ